MVSLVYLCFYFPCLWSQIHKNIAKTSVTAFTACVFIPKFYGFKCYIQVIFCVCYVR